MIAYLQSLPPVDNVLPETRPGPMFYALLGAGPLTEGQSARNIDHEAPYPESVAEGPTAEYVAYLARIAQCTACHGPELAGGQVARSAPIGPNLTPGGELADWSEAEFMTLIRTGMEPSGRQIDPYMPWAYFSQMSDMELRALWAYLQSQPALADQMVPEAEQADSPFLVPKSAVNSGMTSRGLNTLYPNALMKGITRASPTTAVSKMLLKNWDGNCITC